MNSTAVDTKTVTDSISDQARQDGLDQSDAEAIKLRVVEAQGSVDANSALAWTNPKTGSSGSITAIDNVNDAQGNDCRKFETTVNSFGGLTIYNGETCKTAQGSWFLSWLLPKDFAV